MRHMYTDTYETHVYRHMYTDTYKTRTDTFVDASMHAFMHTYIHTYIHTHEHTHTNTHMHACIHAYIHTYLHTYTHTYTLSHTQTYIHTCIHTHMHTHTYTHAYTLTYRRKASCGGGRVFRHEKILLSDKKNFAQAQGKLRVIALVDLDVDNHNRMLFDQVRSRSFLRKGIGLFCGRESQPYALRPGHLNTKPQTQNRGYCSRIEDIVLEYFFIIYFSIRSSFNTWK
jgi:hypothetical protein